MSGDYLQSFSHERDEEYFDYLRPHKRPRFSTQQDAFPSQFSGSHSEDEDEDNNDDEDDDYGVDFRFTTDYSDIPEASVRAGSSTAREVCLGQLMSASFRPSKAVRATLLHSKFPVLLSPLGSDVAVLDASNERYLGVLRGEMSKRLAPFLDHPAITFEAFAVDEHSDSACEDMEVRNIDVFVYAPEEDLDQIGRSFSDNGLHLQHPSSADEITKPYLNPQYLLPKGVAFPDLSTIINALDSQHESNDNSQTSNVTSSSNPTLFDVAKGPQNWTPVSPSKLLRTKLESYQLQAVAMMTEKESGLKEKPEFAAMWKYMGKLSGSRATYRNVINGVCKENPRVSLGGLLADDMGLGKTLTTIALIASTIEKSRSISQAADGIDEVDMSSYGLSVTLVIAPKTTVTAWESQLNEHLKPRTMNICSYYGRNRRKKLLQNPQKFDVILTTYGIIAKEHATTSREATESSPIFSTQWFRVVFDEAHFLRNTSTKLFKAAYAIRAERIWCLTGTPIQNSIADLEALIQILRANPFDNPGTFAYEIALPIKANEKSAFIKLRRLISSLSLRRTKELLHLPPRNDIIEEILLTADEKQLYDIISARLLEQIDKELNDGASRRSLAHVMEQILRLRQICNHGRDLLPSDLLASVENDTQELAAYQSSQTCLIQCEICSSHVAEILSSLECGHLVCMKCSQEHPEAEDDCPLCCGMVEESPQRISVEKLDGAWLGQTRPSSKVLQLVRNLTKLHAAASIESPNKSVVFSEWTSMLDLVQNSLQAHRFEFARIDGQMRAKEWKDQIRNFRQKPSCTVLLASIRNAGTGINLLVANNVHLLESQWNPMVEEQALDRVHRYGQKRPVTTYRYVVQQSIEQYVRQKQAHKRELVSASLDAHRDEKKMTIQQKLQDIRNFFLEQAQRSMAETSLD